MEVFGSYLLVELKDQGENRTKAGLYMPTKDLEKAAQPMPARVVGIPHKVVEVKIGDFVMVSSNVYSNLQRCLDKERGLFYVGLADVFSKLNTQEEIDRYAGIFKEEE